MIAAATLVAPQDDRPALNKIGRDLGYRTSYDGKLLYRASLGFEDTDGTIITMSAGPSVAKKLPNKKKQSQLLSLFALNIVQIYAKCKLDNGGKPFKCDVQSFTGGKISNRRAAENYLREFIFRARSNSSSRRANWLSIDVSTSSDMLDPRSTLCTHPTFCGIPIPQP